MDAWVYHRASRHAEADALVAKLRASGEYSAVIPANTRYYKGETHPGSVVYHDGSRRDLVWANERAGVDVRLIGQEEQEVQEGATPEPNPVAPEPAVRGPHEEVVQRGQWFTAYRDGEKVGAAKRSEEAAWALLEGSR